MRAEEIIVEVPAAGNFGKRMWYHGTSKANYKKILDANEVMPHVADDYAVGPAIWLTSDVEQASEYGEVILAISNQDARKFKLERFSPYPRGTIKKYGVKPPTSYMMIIKEPVPLEYWTLMINNEEEACQASEDIERL